MMAPAPHEWRRWAAQSKLMGVPAAEIRRHLEQQGFDGDAELAALESHPYLEVADCTAQRLRKLESILDVQNELARIGEDAAGIARRRGLSSREFQLEFYARNRPVVLDGVLDEWPALARWTPEYLASRCGDCIVDVMDGREEGGHHEQYVKGKPRAVRFREYVDMVRSAGETNRFYIVATNDFFQRAEIAPLWDDVGRLPEFLDESRRVTGGSFWFGPAGTVTPLHHDTLNILFMQVAGRKAFTLLPPAQTHLLYNDLNLFSEVDAERPDLERFPRYASATPLTVVLGPGETLFLPVGWWHHVRALDVSISLSFTNFRFPNVYQFKNPLIFSNPQFPRCP
jgi:hypothetical protein